MSLCKNTLFGKRCAMPAGHRGNHIGDGDAWSNIGTDAEPEPSADYARGRADALRDAVAALRDHLHAENSMFNMAIETLERLR